MLGPKARISVACCVVLLAALLVRAPNIGADIARNVESTHAPVQDALWYLEAAEGRSPGGRGDPYDRPMWTAMGRAWFSAFGAGTKQADALGATLSFLGVAVVLWSTLRQVGPRAGLAAGVVLALAHPFVALGRTALIYGPMATLLTIACALWLEALAAERRPARVLLGGTALALLASVALLFKLLALIAAPALVAALFASSERRARLAVTGLICALAAGTLAAIDPWHLFSLDLGRIANYSGSGLDAAGLARRFLLLTGMPAQIAMPDQEDPTGRWIGSGVGFGSPLLVPLASMGLAYAWLDRERLGRRARAALALSGAWCAVFVVGATPLDYRPTRYFALIAPPACVLAGWALARLAGAVELGPAVERDRRARVLDALVLFACSAFGAGALAGSLRDILVAGVPNALVRAREDGWIVVGSLAAGAWIGTVAALRPLGARARPIFAAWLLFSFVLFDGGRDVDGLRAPHHLLRTQAATRRICAPGAVLRGPFAGTLAFGSQLGGGKFVGSPTASGTASLARATIAELASSRDTHFAVDAEHAIGFRFAESWKEAGAEPHLVGVFVLGQTTQILLYRFADAERRGYSLSDFERARLLEDAGDEAGARALYGKLDAPCAIARVRALAFQGRMDQARRAADDGPPDDEELAAIKSVLPP
jgi:4-amino-4-deoxy-L-arabinose transferase-like glycosyltransferase